MSWEYGIFQSLLSHITGYVKLLITTSQSTAFLREYEMSIICIEFACLCLKPHNSHKFILHEVVTSLFLLRYLKRNEEDESLEWGQGRRKYGSRHSGPVIIWGPSLAWIHDFSKSYIAKKNQSRFCLRSMVLIINVANLNVY